MNQSEALEMVGKALKMSLKENVEFSLETDLVEESILDSLDSMTFIMDLSELSGKEFPEDLDLVEEGLFRVNQLVDFLQKAA